MAYGPSFKEKTEIEPFENIEVYNLICGNVYLNSTEKCGYCLKNRKFKIVDTLNLRDECSVY